MEDLDLQSRDGLPDALRVLLDDYPPDAWEAHPNFTGLVRFWLERHMMFRRLLVQLQNDVQALLDRKLDPLRYSAHLSRYGSMLVSDLHGHHQIEDHHYFPQLKKLEARIERGFDMLERDHAAMDGLIASFAEAANSVIGAQQDDADLRDRVGGFQATLNGFEAQLLRHLEDEENLVVPVILKSGAAPGI